MQFINIRQVGLFISKARNFYLGQKAPVILTNWLGDLHSRLSEDLSKITLGEITALEKLFDGSEWMPPSQAVNLTQSSEKDVELQALLREYMVFISYDQPVLKRNRLEWEADRNELQKRARKLLSDKYRIVVE